MFVSSRKEVRVAQNVVFKNTLSDMNRDHIYSILIVYIMCKNLLKWITKENSYSLKPCLFLLPNTMINKFKTIENVAQLWPKCHSLFRFCEKSKALKNWRPKDNQQDRRNAEFNESADKFMYWGGWLTCKRNIWHMNPSDENE